MKKRIFLPALILTLVAVTLIGCGRRMNDATGKDQLDTTVENKEQPSNGLTNNDNNDYNAGDNYENNTTNDNLVDGVIDGVEDTVDGVVNGVDDVVDGAGNTLDDMVTDEPAANGAANPR